MVINEMEVVRGITYEKYAALLGEGDIMCRWDIAKMVGVSYSTATYHLERAVRFGLLNKQHGYTRSNQPGWVYALPATMPRLEGM